MDDKNLHVLSKLKSEISQQNQNHRSLDLPPDEFKSMIEAYRARTGWKTGPDVSVKKSRVTKNKGSSSKPEPKVHTSRNPNQSEPQKPKRTDWIKASCKICRTEFAYLPEWKPTPQLCRGCRSERKSFKHKKSGKFKPQYTSCSIYQGGSPGLGKRR